MLPCIFLRWSVHRSVTPSVTILWNSVKIELFRRIKARRSQACHESYHHVIIPSNMRTHRWPYGSCFWQVGRRYTRIYLVISYISGPSISASVHPFAPSSALHQSHKCDDKLLTNSSVIRLHLSASVSEHVLCRCEGSMVRWFNGSMVRSHSKVRAGNVVSRG